MTRPGAPPAHGGSFKWMALDTMICVQSRTKNNEYMLSAKTPLSGRIILACMPEMLASWLHVSQAECEYAPPSHFARKGLRWPRHAVKTSTALKLCNVTNP